jgi:hypothetical protein
MVSKESLFAALVLLLVFPATPALGQTGKDDSPEAAARKALVALKEDRLDDFAKAMHPEALKRFKTLMVAIVDAAAKEGKEKSVLALFSGVSGSEELKKLNDTDFFVSFYRGLTRLRPEMKDLVAGAELQTLGHVMEGKETAHVVYRMTTKLEGATITKMNVMSLQRTADGWALLLSGDIEGVADLLKHKFGGDK